MIHLVRPDEDTFLFKDIREIAEQTRARIEEKGREKLRGKTSISGIPTGLADIDKITDGLPYGITLIGARPEHGLTDFGLTLALNVSAQHRVAYFSPEIPIEITMKRMVSMLSYVSMKHVTESFLAERDLPKVTTALEKILACENLALSDSSYTPEQFYECCKRIQERKGTQMVILNRLQSLFPKRNGPGGESYYWRAREIAGIFHDLVAERGLALVVLSEVKKKKNESECICTDQLRDFGVLEYDAHPILLLERDQCGIERNPNEDVTPISVHISNNIASSLTAQCSLSYLKSYGRFESCARIDCSYNDIRFGT